MAASIWVGYDSRFDDAWRVAAASMVRQAGRTANEPVPIRMVKLEDVRTAGLYWRPTEERDGVLWDVISEAPMSTEFAISRFLVPALARAAGQVEGWALFTDCDVLARENLMWLFALADPARAVMCVKHAQQVDAGAVKMDGQPQLGEVDPRAAGTYTRKNWSSVMLFNLDHPANASLTVDHINTVPGRDLHRFDWLDAHGGEELIGELPARWNYLVGHTVLEVDDEPALVHFTDGIPRIPGHEGDAYADEWLALEEATRPASE